MRLNVIKTQLLSAGSSVLSNDANCLVLLVPIADLTAVIVWSNVNSTSLLHIILLGVKDANSIRFSVIDAPNSIPVA